MKSSYSQKHMIDVLFTIALFCVFTVSALTVIVTGARTYRNISSDTNENYNLRTSLSYINEKVRQADQAGSVLVGDFQGIDALLLKESYEGTEYITYIYPYEHELKELLVRSDTDLEPSSGTTIMTIESCSFRQIADHLISVETTDSEGSRGRLLISPACKGGEFQ